MPEALALAGSGQGLILSLITMFIAGLAFGFAGFGAALIFMPVGAALLGPGKAIGVLHFSALAAIVTVLPEALRKADLGQTLWMLLPAGVMIAPGIWALKALDPVLVRWVVCAVISLCLALIMAGWRRPLRVTRPALAGVGAASGLVGGLTGLTGPVVILFNLSGRDGVERIRANILTFLTLLSGLAVLQLWAQGLMTRGVWWLGALALPVYGAGLLAGRALFDPAHERAYRWIGYLVIGAAVIVGLPLWG